jgi:hypothetical protein
VLFAEQPLTYEAVRMPVEKFIELFNNKLDKLYQIINPILQPYAKKIKGFREKIAGLSQSRKRVH